VKPEEEVLKEFLLKGVGAQILLADYAFRLAEEIGKHAQQINETSFGELFGFLQLMLSDRQTLEVAKLLYPAKIYPTRSIPGTLDILEREAARNIPHRQKLIDTLVQGGANASHLNQLSNEDLTHAVVDHYRTTLAAAPRLVQHRNKVIAHNEDIPRSALTTPTWGEALDVVNYAKDFVITIGLGYLNLLFGTDHSDYLSEDAAKRPSTALRRLVREARIVECRQP
jgi:hypothetical protein